MQATNPVRRRTLLVMLLPAALAACGGSGSATDAAPAPPAPPTPAPPPAAPGISLLAGSLQRRGFADGPVATARFDIVLGAAAAPDGSVYVADSGGLRRVAPGGGVTRVAFTQQARERIGDRRPLSVAVLDGRVYFLAGDAVFELEGSTGARLVAGVPGTSGSRDGPFGQGQLDAADLIVPDGAGNLLVVEKSRLRRVTTAGAVTTIWTVPMEDPAQFPELRGAAVDARGDIFLLVVRGRAGGFEGVVQKLDAAGRPVAWGPAGAGSQPLPAAGGLAITADGSIHVGGGFAGAQLHVLGPDGTLRRTVGRSDAIGADDGPADRATFVSPRAVSVTPGGQVIVVDPDAAALRQVDAAGNVTTVAGGDGQGRRDGAGADARFMEPRGIAAAPDGSLYVADVQGPAVRRVAPDGMVTTLALRHTDGSAFPRAGERPVDVAVDGTGVLVVMTREATQTPRARHSVYRVTGGVAMPLVTGSYDILPPLVVDAASNVWVGVPADGIVDLAVASRRVADGALGPALPVSGTPLRPGPAYVEGAGSTLYGLTRSTVEVLVPEAGSTPLAGNLSSTGHRDGRGTEALFAVPKGLTRDPATGDLYVLDSQESYGLKGIVDRTPMTIRRVSPDGAVRTLAGRTNEGGPVAGAWSEVELGAVTGSLGEPRAMAWSGGALYLTVDHAVVKVVLPA